jgi:hypothetical protein
MTGIELAPDSCVIVDVHRGDGLPRLTALHVVEPRDWPPQRLGRIRRRRPFARHVHAVCWEENAAAMTPLLEAGFIVDRMIGPEEALAIVARDRGRSQTDVATAWLALSRHGAALVIVRGADVLYRRRIGWRYKSVTRLHDQLLQRYSLVAHLGPELQHGIDVVRAEHGIPVDCAITCGDLPDLRSLTMPLIEELDLEVETLDSLDGFEVTTSALNDRAIEFAPALRLAAAATALPPVHAPRSRRWWGRAAAAALIVAGGWMAFSAIRFAPIPPAKEAAHIAPPAPAATVGSSSSELEVVPLIPRPTPASTRTARERPAEPLPSVSSILIGRDRRLAILDGTIVSEGDRIGSRRVTRIERNGVVLRDSSGGEVRVDVPRVKPASQP